MKRYENQKFINGELPTIVKGAVFVNCEFKGTLPHLYDSELHNCDLGNTKIITLINCKLFSTRLDGADFSKADTRYSVTNAGSPCLARGCNWTGVACLLDCSFFQGLIYV